MAILFCIYLLMGLQAAHSWPGHHPRDPRLNPDWQSITPTGSSTWRIPSAPSLTPPQPQPTLRPRRADYAQPALIGSRQANIAGWQLIGKSSMGGQLSRRRMKGSLSKGNLSRTRGNLPALQDGICRQLDQRWAVSSLLGLQLGSLQVLAGSVLHM